MSAATLFTKQFPQGGQAAVGSENIQWKTGCNRSLSRFLRQQRRITGCGNEDAGDKLKVSLCPPKLWRGGVSGFEFRYRIPNAAYRIPHLSGNEALDPFDLELLIDLPEAAGCFGEILMPRNKFYLHLIPVIK
ncbi:MAG: hypothetical protein MZV63_59765 [Marinilabiliales bacterium]|nr:hypothetical protein [Marinilabiliales bacterium]